LWRRRSASPSRSGSSDGACRYSPKRGRAGRRCPSPTRPRGSPAPAAGLGAAVHRLLAPVARSRRRCGRAGPPRRSGPRRGRGTARHYPGGDGASSRRRGVGRRRAQPAERGGTAGADRLPASPHVTGSERLGGLAATILLLCCVAWGLNQVAIKISLAGVSPLFGAGLRSFTAAVLLWAWGRLRGAA